MTTTDRTPAHALDWAAITCPTCKAPPDQPCTYRRRANTTAHLTRQDQAVRTYERMKRVIADDPYHQLAEAAALLLSHHRRSDHLPWMVVERPDGDPERPTFGTALVIDGWYTSAADAERPIRLWRDQLRYLLSMLDAIDREARS